MLSALFEEKKRVFASPAVKSGTSRRFGIRLLLMSKQAAAARNNAAITNVIIKSPMFKGCLIIA